MPKNKQLINVIKSSHIQAGAVATADIADNSITNAKTDSVQPKYLQFMYDFSTQGGAASAISLTDAAGAVQTLPGAAVIANVWLEGVTDNTSGGSATVALGYVGQATAFLGATAFNHAMWNVSAVTKQTVVVATGKIGVAPVSVLATIADAALTAGKWYIWVEYFEGA